MPYIGRNHIAGDHTSNFKLLDDISSYTATFDGSATSVVDTTNNTIRVVEHRLFKDRELHIQTVVVEILVVLQQALHILLFLIVPLQLN